MSLPSLPFELIYDIVDNIDLVADFNAFVRVNKRFHEALGTRLYSFDQRHCGGSALIWSATYKQTRTAEISLSARSGSPREKRCLEAALKCAVASSSYAIVSLLLDNGAEINSACHFSGSALYLASWFVNYDMVKLLIRRGADVNVKGGHYGNALQAASWAGDEKVLKLLLACGADVNAQGGYFGTALQGASWSGNLRLMKLLIDHGADINAKGGHYGSACQAASWTSSEQAVALLIDRGADINAQGGYYGNALQAASWRGHIRIVKLLVAMKADLDAQGGRFGTALEAAFIGGHRRVLGLLHFHRLRRNLSMISAIHFLAATSRRIVINDRVIRYHGTPKTIIRDRDKLLTSNYWAMLMGAIGIQRKLSTAYHPEIDGQTERTNRTLKAYLRTYLTPKQDNWVSLLPTAQLAHNNKTSESTGRTPFFANHGRHPHLFERTLPGPNAEAALQTAEEIKKTHEEMQDRIEKAQRQSISYVNKKRKTAPQLKRGDKVYLLTKNLRTKRPSKGLDHVKVGPFLVLKKNGPVTYTLDLHKDAKVQPRFHVKLLETADPNTPLQRTFRYATEEENEFEVEKILDHRDTEQIKLREYLVKWLGYDNTENTWEPENNLQNCQQRIKEYWKETRRNPSN